MRLLEGSWPSVLGRVVGGDVRGRDSKARRGALFSSANTQTGVWRTQGGKLLFLARHKEREKKGKESEEEGQENRRTDGEGGTDEG